MQALLVRAWGRILFALCMGCALSFANAQDRDWKLITNKDDIKVYRAHTDDSPIKTFRGEAEIALQDFRSIGAIMDDYDFLASWLHMVSGIEHIAYASPSNRTVWLKTELPWPVSDRDTGLKIGLEQDPETFVLTVPFAHAAEAIPKQKGYARIPRMEGYLRFTPMEPGHMHFTIEVILDPGGYVPAWLANMILRDIPYFSLKRFRQFANTKRYQGVDLGYYNIPPGWPGAKPVPTQERIGPREPLNN